MASRRLKSSSPKQDSEESHLSELPQALRESSPRRVLLELQARFASGPGKGFDPAVVLVASAVEANLVNTGLLGAFGDDAADDRRGGLVAAVLQLGLDLGVDGTGRDQRGGALVVDHLGVNVLGASEDGQAGTFCGPKQPLTDAMLAAPAAGLDQQVMVGGVHGTILNSQEKKSLRFWSTDPGPSRVPMSA